MGKTSFSRCTQSNTDIYLSSLFLKCIQKAMTLAVLAGSSDSKNPELYYSLKPTEPITELSTFKRIELF